MTNEVFTGPRALVRAFAETREEGIVHGVQMADHTLDTRTLSESDVVVEVHAAGVAFIDLLMLTGQYHHKPQLPYTPGLEYAGLVRWVGKHAAEAGLKIGDRVMSDFLLTGPRSLGAHGQNGGWGRYAVAPHSALIAMPNALGFDAACNLLLNYETAYFALVHRANLQAGETVLITGATGAAGLAAVQTAKLLGANVIATSRSAEKLKAATALGADHVIDISQLTAEGAPRLRDLVKKLSGGTGAHVFYDTVGGTAQVEALRGMAFGGRMIIVGWADNNGVAAAGGRGGSLAPDLLPTNLIQLKGLTVMGSPMVITGQRDPAGRAERLTTVFEWMRQGKLTPVVSHTFALADLKAAMAARLSGLVVGGCAVRPTQQDLDRSAK